MPDGQIVDEQTNQPYYCRAWKVGLSHGIEKWSTSVRDTITNNQYLMQYNNGEIKNKLSSIYDLYDRTCAANWEDIQQILRFHRQPVINTNDSEPWFLVSDWIEWREVELRWIRKYKAITIYGHEIPKMNQLPNLEHIQWSKNRQFAESVENSKHIVVSNYLKYLMYLNFTNIVEKDRKWIDESWIHQNEVIYWNTEHILFNMWMLSKADFFVSSWFSTVTQTICHWRGKRLMYKSTNCYLNQKWAETKEELWFDIDAIDEPKLPWNNIKTLEIQQ